MRAKEQGILYSTIVVYLSMMENSLSNLRLGFNKVK